MLNALATMKRTYCIIAAVCIVMPAWAQVGTVGSCPGPIPTGLTFSPSAPTSADSVTIVVHAPSFAPQTVFAQVAGNVINVTMTGASLGLIPPPICGIVVVGPLQRGGYTLNYFLVRDAGPATLQASMPLSVADPIPVLSQGGLVVLAAMLGAIGWWNGRRRRLVWR